MAGNSKSKDNSQWFSLFADLDPLANPDAIGKTTKESDPNCYSWIKFQFFKVITFLMLEPKYLLLLMVVSSWSRFLNVTYQNKIPLSHMEIILPHLLHRTTQKSYIITVNQNSKNLKLNGETYLKKKTLNYNFRWFVIILLSNSIIKIILHTYIIQMIAWQQQLRYFSPLFFWEKYGKNKNKLNCIYTYIQFNLFLFLIFFQKKV